MVMAGERPVPFLRAEFPPAIADAVAPVLTSGYVGAGPVVAQFERSIQSYLRAPDVICTSSGTAALSLAYQQLGAVSGAKALSTAMTCAATNLPLLHAGVEVVWLDVDPRTGNVTPASLEHTMRAHPDARLAVIVDWAGTPCDYEGLRRVALSHGIPVVLDAAQSFGSAVNGSRVPTVGDYVCYSFGPTKMLSSIEGGAVLTADDVAAQRLRAARWYGIDRDARDPVAFWQYDITEPGHRYTSNDVFATIGLQMLARLDERLRLQRRMAAIYLARLADLSGLTLPPVESSVNPNFWMFTVTVERRANFIRKLHDHAVHAATPHNRNDRLTCFSGLPRRDLPGLTDFAENYVCLPIGIWLSEDDIERVCQVIRSGW
jgi:dTDP-4-amino-4,6-dideoxygalactose transaminase